MDYLRTLGSAAVSSIVQKSGLNLPFTIGEKFSSFENKSIWSLHDGIKRDDNTPVSIFVFTITPNSRNLLPLAKNAVRKLRTVRHPEVLRFLDAVESDSVIYIMTERVQPLSKVMQAWDGKGKKGKENWLVWGLHRITVALSFINQSLSATHGIIRTDSIFISPSGEWKLGGFELLSKPDDEAPVLYTLGGLYPGNNDYASPEVRKGGWSVLKDHHPSISDAYSLGILIHCIFNPNVPLPATIHPPHPPPTISSRGNIPSNIFSSFKKLLNPNPKTRLSAEGFLGDGMAVSGEGTGGTDSGFFANNKLVQVCTGLDKLSYSSESERNLLLRSLKDSGTSFPPEFISHRIVPSLVSSLEFGGASASAIIPLVLQFGTNVSPEQYSTIILAPILKLFGSPDRATRIVLLEHLNEYEERLDKKAVCDKIWPHLRTGFTDTVPVIRESTVKAVGILYPKFTDRILNNDLLRHLAQLQIDTEPSIRTNTCILIGRLGPSLGHNTKKKILVPAFTRALKDVFVHARVAGIMSFMASVECFEMEDVAGRVVPVLASVLLDKEKLVRDQAFKALELFIKKLETHAATMPETALDETGQPNSGINVVDPSTLGGQGALVNSAAGAATALAGWAMSSITKKLVPGDMQQNSTTTTASVVTVLDRPTSAPPPPLTGLTGLPNHIATGNGHGRPGALPLSGARAEFTVSSPGVTSTNAIYSSSSRGVGKGLQLNATKASSSFKTAGFGADLANEWTREAEAEAEALNAWGNDDLMDVNADDDDWSAFESAPMPGSITIAGPSSRPTHTHITSVLAPKPVTATGGAHKILVADNDDNDAWGDMDDTVDDSVASAFEIDNKLTYPTLNIPKNQYHLSNSNSSTISRTKSPPIRGSTSDISNVNSVPIPSTPTTPSINAVNLSTMSKEEKAAEMARRKEERKMRIAQLKEQKKSSSSGKS